MFGTPSLQMRCIWYFRWIPNFLLSSRFHRSAVTFHNFGSYRMACACHLQCSHLLSVRKTLGKEVLRNYALNRGTKCWNCNKTLEMLKFSCLNCGVLQHPDPDTNFFELMELPRRFDLNADDISSKYKTLQMMFHPDRYVRKSKEEIEISDSYSRLVNEAYSTLRNPLSRGLYILQLNGIETDDGSVKMDQQFLMEILEKNEELDNVKDPEELKEMSETNSKTIAHFISMTSKAFQANDLILAREALMKMKYFVNIENEIKKKKSDLGIVD